MKLNPEIKVKRIGQKGLLPERRPAAAPPSDITVRITLPPAETAVIPGWFELGSPGGTSLLLRLPEASGGLTFGGLYKAVKEAGGTITADA